MTKKSIEWSKWCEEKWICSSPSTEKQSSLNVQGKQRQNTQITIRIYEPTITKYWPILKAKQTFWHVDLSLRLNPLGKS